MKQKLYNMLRDQTDELTVDTFFRCVEPDGYAEDEKLRDLLLDADEAYWKLADYLARKTGN